MYREYLRLDSQAPVVSFIQPNADAARTLSPGSQPVSYSGSDPENPAPATGIAGYTLNLSRGGSTRVLVNNALQTALDADLDFPCQSLTLTVFAQDQSGNADEARGDRREAFVLLRGDANGDGLITEDDYDLIREADGLTSSDASYSTRLDPTGDGLISAADRVFVETRLRHACPQP